LVIKFFLLDIFPINPYGGPVTVETHYGESYEGKSAIIKNGNEEVSFFY